MSEIVKVGSLTKLINDSIGNIKRDENRDYIGASYIGNPCERSIWYLYNQYHNYFTPKQFRNFAIGKNLESLILDYLENAGLALERNWETLIEPEVPTLKGHIDAMWLYEDREPRAVIEVKTARDSSFNNFVKKGLKEWSQTYYAQLQAYMGMSKVYGGYLIALNKDTSELHDEYVLFDKNFYESLKAKAKYISEAKEPPKKINNSPLFYICRSCPFKGECHR